MNGKFFVIMGSVFIIASGLIYTTERVLAYISWNLTVFASTYTGSFPTSPELPGLFTNIYIPILILIGVVFCILGFKKLHTPHN